MRDWKGALEWYRTHQTTAQIGFNPNGMCLKVCRTARAIASKYLTAKIAQDNTPKEHRVYKVADLRRGMIGFFDDPNDSNTAGHIATMVGRVRGGNIADLHYTLWETNSVVDGQLVVVRGDYFSDHWNDRFQFGATWLNGEVLDVPARKKDEPAKKTPPTLGDGRRENFRESRPNWDVNILDRAVGGGRGDLAQRVKEIDKAVDNLPDDEKGSKVKEFKETYQEKRILKMWLLNQAVEDGRTGAVKAGRDRLRQLIKSLIR